MGFVIGLIIGLCVGAAIAYFLTSKKTTAHSAAVQDLQRQLDLADAEHERRLREATARLRQDYEAQLQAARTAAPAQSNASSTGAAPAATVPTAPLPPTSPAPAPINEEPTPITATSPAPVPQSVPQSPTVPDTAAQTAKDNKPQPQRGLDDPNALLAASYALDSATRAEVATAIAPLISTSGAKAQARWLPVLSRLVRDPDPDVRIAAINSLPAVTASKRLPLLQRALRDPNPAVVATAHALISQSKGRSRTSRPTKKRRLPKNQ